jgi:hypothetical protein
MTADVISKQLWWTNVFPVDIIPPWFSMRDEQWARWWPQFTDVVSPHQHDDHHQVLDLL